MPCGPPPRAWGKPGRTWHTVCPLRSTPTRVGKTPIRPEIHGLPRGPPPRAWGEHKSPGCLVVDERSTPTRVGKTNEVARGGRYSDGPPPRAWGKRSFQHRVVSSRRSTPTRVGKTCTGSSCSRVVTVHPHARGENFSGTPIWYSTCGPPPRAWGKLRAGARRIPHHRSTPTRVGKTQKPVIAVIFSPVHPHARGENSRPACPTSRRPVHPHARGENVLRQPHELERLGPPPRAWGKRLGDRVVFHDQRSTPTRVGKTLAAPFTTQSSTTSPTVTPGNPPTGPPPRAWGKL